MGVIAPAFTNTYPNFEVNVLAKHLGNIFTRQAGNFTQFGALLTDHDAFVAFAVDQQGCEILA